MYPYDFNFNQKNLVINRMNPMNSYEVQRVIAAIYQSSASDSTIDICNGYITQPNSEVIYAECPSTQEIVAVLHLRTYANGQNILISNMGPSFRDAHCTIENLLFIPQDVFMLEYPTVTLNGILAAMIREAIATHHNMPIFINPRFQADKNMGVPVNSMSSILLAITSCGFKEWANNDAYWILLWPMPVPSQPLPNQ